MEGKVILWDFDGTLADTGADVWDSVEYAAGKLGGTLEETFRRKDSNLGKSVEEIFRHVQPFPGDEKERQFDELIRVHYRTISVYGKTVLYDGIREILKWTKQESIKNIIITMKPEKALECILQVKGWGELFDGWYSPDSFGEKEKTKAEVIRLVLERRDISRENCLYIGDTWSDVAAAHINKIRCAAVTYGDGDCGQLLAQRPDICAENPLELYRLLKEEI